MNMNTDRLMAWAQIIFSVMVFLFVAAVFMVFETGHAKLSADELKIYERDVGWLKDAALVVLYFWFQRARQGGIPDGNVITQTHTTPDGTTVVTRTPVAAADKVTVQVPLAPTPQSEKTV